MKQSPMTSYAELTRLLSKTKLKLHPSEAHGLICGMICGSQNLAEKKWEKIVTGEQDEIAHVHDVLQNLYNLSAQQLEEFLFNFQLILPADSQELPFRAEALTLWCQGFLMGLEQEHIQIVDREPSELTEAINDLIEISKMNYEDVVASEEDEAAYVELVEFVRMAIILIYQDLHEDSETREARSSNHIH